MFLPLISHLFHTPSSAEAQKTPETGRESDFIFGIWDSGLTESGVAFEKVAL